MKVLKRIKSTFFEGFLLLVLSKECFLSHFLLQSSEVCVYVVTLASFVRLSRGNGALDASYEVSFRGARGDDESIFAVRALVLRNLLVRYQVFLVFLADRTGNYLLYQAT